jgi:hypothetical protein
MVYDETVVDAGEDATIWIKKDGQDPQVVPPCEVDGVAKPHPCRGLAHVKRNGDIRYNGVPPVGRSAVQQAMTRTFSGLGNGERHVRRGTNA